MGRDEMSNLYRGPSIDVSYQIYVHLVKRFQMRTFCPDPLTTMATMTILVSGWSDSLVTQAQPIEPLENEQSL
jgi:hypothetical protein